MTFYLTALLMTKFSALLKSSYMALHFISVSDHCTANYRPVVLDKQYWTNLNRPAAGYEACNANLRNESNDVTALNRKFNSSF